MMYKMKVGLFLGAGASVPFNKPITLELKRKLTTYTGPVDIKEEILQSFLNDVYYEDIEYVFQAVHDIINFSESKGGKYFFTRGQNGIFNYYHGGLPFDTFIMRIRELGKHLEKIVYDNYRWINSTDIENLTIYENIFEFLEKHSDTIKIFTTNYDRVIEECCNKNIHRYACIDGFERKPSHSEISRWTNTFDIPESDNLKHVCLYKLHGSLNWKEHNTHGIIKTNEEGLSTDSNFKRNIVILPTLSPKMEEDVEPFLTLLRHFENYMEEANSCIVIGSSFRDSNIKRIFTEFIKSGKTLVVVSPHSMETTCKYLLDTNVPENFDPSKINFLAPTNKGKVWCIRSNLDKQNLHGVLEVTLALISKN